LDLATTWDTTGTPTAIKVNATNTNSNPATKFIDLQLSTVSKFRVGKGGNIFSGANAVTADGGTGVAGVSLEMLFANYGIGVDGNGNCQFLLNGTARSRVGFGVCIGNNQTFSFSDLQHTGLNSVPDVLLARDAAGILAQRNGTAKQVHRVYNTFLGTTANEWGGFDWLTTSNTLRIGTDHAGTGGARDLQIITNGIARLTIQGNGNASFTNTVGFGGNVNVGYLLGLASLLVSQLPAASGTAIFSLVGVSNATVTAALGKGTTVVGGGANKVIVMSDGTNWVIL